MKSIRPVVKKLLKHCIPTLKAKKRSSQLTAIENDPTTTASDPPYTFELPLAAVQVAPVSIGMPVPRIPSQKFETFFLKFNQPAQSPIVTRLVAPGLRPASPMADNLPAPLEMAPSVSQRPERHATQGATRLLEDVILENSPVAKREVDAVIVQENLIFQRQLARVTNELEAEIDASQALIDMQEAIIRELEDATSALELDLATEKLRTASLEAEAARTSDIFRETIKAKDKEIARLRIQLAERDEAQKNQVNTREGHEVVERQPAAYTIKDVIDLKKKLRSKIAAKTDMDTKLAKTEAERNEAIAQCEKQAEAAQIERDRLLEQCQKLERKVTSLVATLGIYNVAEPWVKCFENDDGREALDNIMLAKFLTPFKCTSGDNPNAMRLSELGSPVWRPFPGAVGPTARFKGLRNTSTASPTPESRIRKLTPAPKPAAKDLTDSLAFNNGAIVVNILPKWTLPRPVRGTKSREIDL